MNVSTNASLVCLEKVSKTFGLRFVKSTLFLFILLKSSQKKKGHWQCKLRSFHPWAFHSRTIEATRIHDSIQGRSFVNWTWLLADIKSDSCSQNFQTS